ncbi:MAG: DUF1501 domain-containing protein, partial [Planctomycetes bacterium]|nr:DUF1501 domain-containing protein [Planctomycetota bacterium]
MLRQCGAGFGSLALTGLLADLSAEALAKAEAQQTDSLAPRPPQFPARAKRVIFLFMHGGPSAVDTFDYKPLLLRDSGKPLPFAKPRVVFAQTNNLLRSPWEFSQHGESGTWVSSLFPNVARYVDDLAIVKSLHGSNPAHGGACLKIHTGSDTFVRPSFGAWVSYGLGTENRNLPSFITLNPTLGHGGVQNYGAGFLPAIHQGTRIALPAEAKTPITIPNATNSELSADEQRLQIDLVREMGRLQKERTGADAALEARIESFELAFRMQSTAPGVMDLNGESEAMKKMYGLGVKPTDSFARQCLLARRFAEAGVRFIQVTHGYWDQHSELKSKHEQLAAEVDRPIAALLFDLKSRGLLEDTLVIWGGEFGRTPVAEGKDGRDHNPHGFTWWLAGGGVKGGRSFGSTDDYGFYAAEDKVHVHDLHATILHLLGMDHLRLTFRHAGRDFRLTDV